MSAYVAKVTTYLPDFILDNKKLASQFPEWNIDKIYEKTGIHKRHIAADDESCSDMAVKAAEKLFLTKEILKEDIDYLLLCTQSPDYLLPTTACLVQSKLGLPVSCGALDFNLGCSGYVYGLSLAKGLIETNQAKNVLLITSELYSRYLSKEDKSVRTLFGDAATATLIKDDKTKPEQIGPFIFGTDGKGAKNLIVPDGGSKSPISSSSNKIETDKANNKRAPKNLFMNGAEILTFTLNTVPASVYKLLSKVNIKIDDINYIILHQANKFMLDKLRKKLKVTTEKFLVSFEEYGNTVSSSIPLGLAKVVSENKIKKGDKIMLVGFGVGYSWAATIITM